nr:hypothetical protein [Tanacetum cinerariifolium]
MAGKRHKHNVMDAPNRLWSGLTLKLVVEIKSFGMSSDKLDEKTGSSDGLQPKQADLSYVHALNELYLHEICVVPSKHEADQRKALDEDDVDVLDISSLDSWFFREGKAMGKRLRCESFDPLAPVELITPVKCNKGQV